MDPEFLIYLQGLRELCDFPFLVTSGYRCESHNSEVSKRSMNDHVRGKAVDISITDRYKRAIILDHILEVGYFKDIAIADNFIHVGKGKTKVGIGFYGRTD